LNSISLKNNQRINHLDGLRGLLALAVFIHHFLYCFAPVFIVGAETPALLVSGKLTIYRLFAFTPLNLIYNAGVAVDFFFIISGYVLSYSYFVKQDILIVQQNALKRYIRLAIPVLASCLLLWLFHVLGLIYRTPIPKTDMNANWLPGLIPDYLNFGHVLKYSLLDTFTGNSRYNPVLWTMQIELLGSMMVFFILLATHTIRNSKKVWLFILFLLILSVAGSSLLKAFLCGTLICFLQTSSARFVKIFSITWVKLLALLIGIYFASFPMTGVHGALDGSIYRWIHFADNEKLFQFYYTTGCCLILLVVLNSRKVTRILSLKPAQFLGKVSFGLYLIHLPLIFVLSSRIYEALSKHMYDYAGIPLTFLLSLLYLFVISWFFYRFIDFYALKWASKFAKFFLPG